MYRSEEETEQEKIIRLTLDRAIEEMNRFAADLINRMSESALVFDEKPGSCTAAGIAAMLEEKR